jgi:cholesterol transport system auxiliary component
MKSPARLIVMLGTLALTACSMLVGKHEDLTVYAPILAQPAESSAQVARAWELGIAEPRAISPLDGAHIAVMPAAGELQTYKGARWRDASPVLIQQLLLQAFRDSVRLSGVGVPTSVPRADFALLSDLQDFQAEYRGAKFPTIVIRLNAQLVDNSTGRVVASRTFAVEETSAGAGVPEVFAAFQTALNKLLPQVVAWSAEAGDANWRVRPKAGR